MNEYVSVQYHQGSSPTPPGHTNRIALAGKYSTNDGGKTWFRVVEDTVSIEGPLDSAIESLRTAAQGLLDVTVELDSDPYDDFPIVRVKGLRTATLSQAAKADEALAISREYEKVAARNRREALLTQFKTEFPHAKIEGI